MEMSYKNLQGMYIRISNYAASAVQKLFSKSYRRALLLIDDDGSSAIYFRYPIISAAILLAAI